MASDWPIGRLRDIADVVMGQSPSAEFVNTRSCGLPLLNGPTEFGSMYPSPAQFTTDARKKAAPGDLLFCVRGSTTGRMNWGDQEYAIGRGLAAIRHKNGGSFQHFIRAVIKSCLPNLLAAATGSTFPNVGRDQLLDLPISIPPNKVQEEISRILRDIDEKIEVSRCISQTLEAMAQAIFKSWFVDFDPVKARIAAIEKGQDPLRAAMSGISGKTDDELEQMPRDQCEQLAAIAALFPEKMEESVQGEIPVGWEVESLAKVTTYLNRGISPKYLESGGVLVLNQKCIRDFRVDVTKGRRHDPAQRKIDGRELQLGDVLVNSTGVGTLGRVAQILHLDEVAIVDSHVTAVRAGQDLSALYLGQYIKWKQPEIEAMGEGSTGQTELSRSKLAEYLILKPQKAFLNEFDRLVRPITEEISSKEREAARLAELRDTLLPKLLSGELSVVEPHRKASA